MYQANDTHECGKRETNLLQELSIDFLGDTSVFGRPLEEGESRSEESEEEEEDEVEEEEEEEEEEDVSEEVS